MKTRCLIELLLTYAPTSFLARDGAAKVLNISGKLEEAGGKPVLFANLAVYNSSDSSLVGGAVSDQSGSFTINALPGKYFLKISYLGLNEKIVPNMNVHDQCYANSIMAGMAYLSRIKIRSV